MTRSATPDGERCSQRYFHRSDRAVSEVLSFTLVFTLIIVSITLVSVSGLQSLQDVRDVEQIDNAERAFDVLADNAADIHQHGAPSRATEISLGESQLRTGATVGIEAHVRDGSNNTIRRENWNVRPLVYEGAEDRMVVYTAGSVFRTNRDSGVVVRDPPLIAENDRVLVPVVGINRPSVQSLSGSTVLVRLNHRGSYVMYRNRSSKVGNVQVNVTGTAHPELWETSLENDGFNCDVSGSDTTCAFHPTPIDRVYVVYHDIRVNIDR